MEKDILDDIEILDEIEIVDEINDDPSSSQQVGDLLSDFGTTYTGDFGMKVEEVPVLKEEPITVPTIELPEEVVVEDIMSKTYNLAEVIKVANEETVVEKDEFDGRKSAVFIGVLFVVLVVFVLALPYITKLMVK